MKSFYDHQVLQSRRRPGRQKDVAPALIPLLRGEFIPESDARKFSKIVFLPLLVSMAICTTIGAILFIAVRFW